MKFIKPLSDFINESTVNEGVSYQNIAKELVEIAAYYTDVDLSSEMTNAMKCSDAKQVLVFYSDLKDTMKSEEPGKFKEFEIEASRFLGKNKINESTNEHDNDTENYMFFGNLNTIKKHAEMILALDKAQVDSILSNGHDWANDHIATSKDDIEEVCNFLQNETKEAGTGVKPSNESTNEAMVQVAGKGKPAGAKVLATVMVQFMEQNKMLDSNFTASAHGGKNQKYMIDELANFIMENTF